MPPTRRTKCGSSSRGAGAKTARSHGLVRTLRIQHRIVGASGFLLISRRLNVVSLVSRPFPTGQRFLRSFRANGMGRPLAQSIRSRYSNLAGTENGLVASTTNIMSAFNSVVPLLKTSIVVPAGCPFIECPASTFITPCGVR
jgi:hypothetical protein